MITKADRIAAAWVTACRATGDDPLRFGQWGWNSKARQVLFTVLDRAQFGPSRAIARLMGAPNKDEADSYARNKAKWRFSLWWSPELVTICERSYREGQPQDVSGIVISELRGGARTGAGRPSVAVSLPMPGDKDTPAPDHPDEPAPYTRRVKAVTLPAIPSLRVPKP